MIKGLYETHIHVADLNRSRKFYEEILKLELGLLDEQRKSAFYWIGGTKKFMLGILEKPTEEIKRTLFAFECKPEWVLNESVNFLKNHNLKFWNFLNDGIERPMVFAWMPAVSIYFEDPDGHELEFIGILDCKSRPQLRVLSYEDCVAIERSNR